MIRVVTVDREYECGGPVIGEKLADHLGWTLWDQSLSREIARLANADLGAVRDREERQDPLYYRLFKAFLRGSFEANLQMHRLRLLDADRIVALTEQVVREIATAGHCVIVGRGSQYFLKDRPDTYHVFLYAPYEEKIRRGQSARRSRAETVRLVDTTDQDRAAFIKRYFAKEWPSRSPYHLMVNTKIGDDAVVHTIVEGMAALKPHQRETSGHG